jgi:TRAP-type uncharacterized transport system fused permease subunit
MKKASIKKILIRLLAVIVILVIVLSPYLLIIDFKRFSPFVLMIWFLSFAYYLLMRKRVQHLIDMRNAAEDEEEDSE